MNDSLSSFVRPSDCFQAARSSTKANAGVSAMVPSTVSSVKDTDYSE